MATERLNNPKTFTDYRTRQKTTQNNKKARIMGKYKMKK